MSAPPHVFSVRMLVWFSIYFYAIICTTCTARDHFLSLEWCAVYIYKKLDQSHSAVPTATGAQLAMYYSYVLVRQWLQ